MKNDFDETLLSLFLDTVNDFTKTDPKAMEDTLKIQRIIGNSDLDLGTSYECSAVLDFCLISAAYQHYSFKKKEKDIPSKILNLSDKKWDKNYALINDTNCVQQLDVNSDFEKTLSGLQMDTDLVSEWPKFNADFLNMSNFLDEQIGPDNILNISSYNNPLDENSFSNSSIIDFEMCDSDLKSDPKSSSNESSENLFLKKENESFEIESVISKSSMSLSHPSINAREDNSVFKCFYDGYFPEELDYEPSDTGETEVKENDSEFLLSNIMEERENGSFFSYCSEYEASKDSSCLEKLKELDLSENLTDICTHEDFVSFFQNNLDPVSDKNMLQNGFEECREYDDDSESDSEHSFKRSSSRNRMLNSQALQQSLNDSDVNHLNDINEVMLDVYEQCKSGNISEAITIAKKYIVISIESVQIEIFKELFINIISLIKNSVFPVKDTKISKSLEDTMAIFYQSKLFDSDLCSLIISECFDCDFTFKTGLQFISFVQENKVNINNNAVASYVSIMSPSEIPSNELISFLEYVKYVCILPCPQTALSEATERFSKHKESTSAVEFLKLCKLLCSVSSMEVDINHLQSFIQLCIKNDYWMQVANFFEAWYKDGNLISCISQSLLFQADDVGLFYERLAEEIYRLGDVSMHLVGILGQIGVFIMLEVFSQKQYMSAFEVLFILHKHNINYFDLQVCLYEAPTYLRSILNFADVCVFPFTVAFAALDICLHLKRFKDAYSIFKNFSLNLPDYMDDTLKLNVRCQRFVYLLNLTQELSSKEPLNLGLQAFHDIYLATKDFSIKELESFAEDIQVIYNKYLTCSVNECQLNIALELYEYSRGVMNKIFVIQPHVLRGLLVTFAQNDRMEKAYEFFSLGCARKIYDFEQTKTENLGWKLTILSSWTALEMEIIFRTFMKNIFIAWDDERKIRPDMPITVKIVFKKSKEDCSEIVCLKRSCDLSSAKDTASQVLLTLDPNIKWIEVQDPTCLDIVPDTICNFLMKFQTCPDLPWLKNAESNLKPSQNVEFKTKPIKENEDCESDGANLKTEEFGQLPPEHSSADSCYQVMSPKEAAKTEISEDAQQKLIVPKSSEQEEIISSSPDSHASKALSVTPGGSLSKMDASIDNSAGICFTIDDQVTSRKNEGKIRTITFPKSIRQPKYKRNAPKAAKSKKKPWKIRLKKCSRSALASKKVTSSSPEKPGEGSASFKRMPKSWKTENFRITLKPSAQDGRARMVSEVKSEASISNVPGAVFQKIVSFLKSKVMLKSKELQPPQLQEKVDHLASLFIQRNAVNGLDKRTMKLLCDFAEGSI